MAVGNATFTFANGNSATMTYTINGQGGLPAVTQTKTLARFLFGPNAVTVCS